MIGRMPLWMILFVWFTQQRQSGFVSMIDYAQRLRLLEDMRGLLPVPIGKIQIWMVRTCLEWIDGEKEMLLSLRMMHVVAVGLVRDN